MASWTPVVDVNMLVRRPAAEVYEAFADPDRVRRFWLAASSGRLETGTRVHWTFKVAGAETDVDVIEADPHRLLDLRWDDGQPVRITFEDRGGVGRERSDCRDSTTSAGLRRPGAGRSLRRSKDRGGAPDAQLGTRGRAGTPDVTR
ncbi:SRPBCC domain-containing protein [Actinoplanes sp. NBRC 103695]|uniref:SRPBCC domain-containing protein n=1 Tax=Actinoplanes sp. NBRC 103695 TaxID=3032202 RepID=UPI00249FC796|nr:SRPBCC domain-containing protein [Actinoplanes sp. NBRC 103695]GLY97759.1 hypothetical protein Acsp02_50130 [Actinoplanes sp. NBRC 103695]